MNPFRQSVNEQLRGAAPQSDIDEICDLAQHASDEAINTIERITRNASRSKLALAALVYAIDLTANRGRFVLSTINETIREAQK